MVQASILAADRDIFIRPQKLERNLKLPSREALAKAQVIDSG